MQNDFFKKLSIFPPLRSDFIAITAHERAEKRQQAALDALYDAGFKDFNTNNTAILLVDVQDRYASDISHRTAYRIQSLLPAFRELGLPVYAAYVSFGDNDPIKFTSYIPEKNDILACKRRNSAFEDKVDLSGGVNKKQTMLNTFMHVHGIENLITCGGYFNACLYATVIDALTDFNVCVLEDLSTDTARGIPSPHKKEMMIKHGAVVANAVPVLRAMRRK
jgi:nicotinamidase-related amidase